MEANSPLCTNYLEELTKNRWCGRLYEISSFEDENYNRIFNTGYSGFMMNEYDRAKDCFEELLEKKPGDLVARFAKKDAYMRNLTKPQGTLP